MGFMFDIFPVVFFLMFFAVFGIIIYNVVKSISVNRKNNAAPVLDVYARVVAKRTGYSGNTTQHTHHGHTYYWVTFQFHSGDRSEFQVNGQEYGMLVEGDEGMLRFQGTRYLNFTRNMQ